MNISNAEFKNSMGTIRTDLPINHVGLIKSASTSTCCANENISENQRKSVPQKYLIKDDSHYKRFVIEPSPHVEKSLHEKILAHKNIRNKLRYNNAKHFSDCDIDKEVSNSLEKISNCNVTKSNDKKEFHTHLGLDKILVNEENNNSVINFAAVNDSKANICQRMDATDDGNECESICQTKSSFRELMNCKDSSQRSDNICSKLSSLNGNRKTVNNVNLSETPEKNEEKKLSLEEEKTPLYETKNAESLIASSAEGTSQNIVIEDTKQQRNETFLEKFPESCVEHKDRNVDKPFRRSSSLKIHKESTSTPAQKKIVRFADVLGLDLTDVRTFLDELPSVPKSAYDDLKNEETVLSESPPKFGPPSISESKSLVPTFRSPVGLPDFLEKVRDNLVSLETAFVFNSPVCHITGTVRVRNLDFYKSVYVRYTVDSWKTFSEVQANYVPDSCDGFSDKFAFVIYVYSVTIGQRIELAVRYHCCGSIFWDNNNGSNYVFQCFPATPSMPSYFQNIAPNREHCNSFY